LNKFEILGFGSPEALARAAAEKWLGEIGSNCSTAAPYCVALSGGRVAARFFSALAAASKPETALSHVHFFWGDERCVPPDDPESNYRLAWNSFLSCSAVAPSQIHRIRGEVAPAEAATEAEDELRRIAPPNAAGQPVLDMIFLGMGEDGHVASLFPDELPETPVNPAVFRPVVSRHKPPPQRITLGYPAIAAARQVWVLVSGPGKREALRRALSLDANTPLGYVLASREKTSLLTDFATGKSAGSP
jgi:6-phosphogluconolactonase